MKSNWRRLACSVILALFSASVIAGMVCTGHLTSHSARAQGWIAKGSESSQGAHGSRAMLAPAVEHQDAAGHGVAPYSDAEDGACDPPVYAGTPPSSDNTKQTDRTSLPQLDAVASDAIGLMWSAFTAADSSHSPPCSVVKRPRDVLALCPRLRI